MLSRQLFAAAAALAALAGALPRPDRNRIHGVSVQSKKEIAANHALTHGSAEKKKEAQQPMAEGRLDATKMSPEEAAKAKIEGNRKAMDQARRAALRAQANNMTRADMD